MRITVNGVEQVFPKEMTLKELLGDLEMEPGQIAVARNGTVVPRSQHESVLVRDGDHIEIVKAVAGG